MTESDLFAAFGRAVLHAQIFERQLRGLVSLADAVGNHDCGPLHLTLLSLPIGPLLEKGRPWIEFDATGQNIIEEARLRRNRLCHDWFYEHEGELGSPEDRRLLIEKLDQDVCHFRSATSLCKGALDAYLNCLETLVE